jgi:hypothetical protein
MNNKTRHTKFSGWLFLCIYLFLLGLIIPHYHHYDFNNYSFLDDTSSKPLEANDIIQDFSGSCIVHHFANTLLNDFHSSSEVLKINPPYTEYFYFQNSFNTSPGQNSSISLRAPPALV